MALGMCKFESIPMVALSSCEEYAVHWKFLCWCVGVGCIRVLGPIFLLSAIFFSLFRYLLDDFRGFFVSFATPVIMNLRSFSPVSFVFISTWYRSFILLILSPPLPIAFAAICLVVVNSCWEVRYSCSSLGNYDLEVPRCTGLYS